MNIVKEIESSFDIKYFNNYKNKTTLDLYDVIDTYMISKYSYLETNLKINISNNIAIVISEKYNFTMSLYFKQTYSSMYSKKTNSSIYLESFNITELVNKENNILTTTDIGDSLVEVNTSNEGLKAKLESLGISKEQIIKFINEEDRKEVLPKTNFRKLEVFEKIGINSQLLYNKMMQYKTFIAGSYPLSLKMEDPELFNDIDFFIYETDNYNFLINWFKTQGFEHKTNEYNPTYRAMLIKDKISMTKDGVKIDLVCLNQCAFNNPVDYVSKWFDINICMYILDYKGQLLTTSFNHYYHNKLKNKENIMVRTWYKGTAFRVVKYYQKGYKFKTETLIKADAETGKLKILNDPSVLSVINNVINRKK